jgi:DNA-binding IclR family transcriptional regulator
LPLFSTFLAIYSGCCTVAAQFALSEGLHESIVAARAQRYALVEEEFGLVSVAALVRDFKGQLVAARSVSAPKFHLGGWLEGPGRKSRGCG